ncbi:hypothetical protein PIB30_065725 [Stylosanthes scabra]|uniref:Uncharacterized protein n=1 Tax=Stylosanthes scabra TaxID=79078 RepID=A0ABU6QLK8_9FABA|nr:hypothetical protein [Stylosanthes scabra]
MYVLIWKDPSNKLRTQLDQINNNNPFRVTPKYLASVTSRFSVVIYIVGTFNDHLIGTPCFSSVQLCYSQGDYKGVERGRQGGGRVVLPT